MARPTIVTDDFKGWIKIVSNDFKGTILEDYIDTFYEQYVRQIIGDAAYLAVESVDRPKWIDLFSGRSYVDLNGDNKKLDGLTVSILKFIYFEFIRDNFTSSQVGKVDPSNENSVKTQAIAVSAIAVNRYNSGVRILNSSMPDYLADFDELSTPVTGFVDNADDSYTINVANTTYLLDGDTVTINDVDYGISGLVANTSFVIDGGSVGLSFDGDVSWKPYNDVEFTEMDIIGL